MDTGSTVQFPLNDSGMVTSYLAVVASPGMAIVKDTAVGRKDLDPRIWPLYFKDTVETTQGEAEYQISVTRGFAYLIPRGRVGSPVEVARQAAALICPVSLAQWLDQQRIAAQANTA